MTKNMTWKEFKEFIDKELEEQDISPDVEIWYIDISFPKVGDKDEWDVPDVSISKMLGIAIG